MVTPALIVLLQTTLVPTPPSASTAPAMRQPAAPATRVGREQTVTLKPSSAPRIHAVITENVTTRPGCVTVMSAGQTCTLARSVSTDTLAAACLAWHVASDICFNSDRLFLYFSKAPRFWGIAHLVETHTCCQQCTCVGLRDTATGSAAPLKYTLSWEGGSGLLAVCCSLLPVGLFAVSWLGTACNTSSLGGCKLRLDMEGGGARVYLCC
jgi:hypothetical protein